MQFDPLNDALVKIYNAEQAGKFDVELTPASKLLGNVLNIMPVSYTHLTLPTITGV